jgi:tetraacyldisaccharide 4'-kinase
MKGILAPLSYLFEWIVRLRTFLYAKGLVRTRRLFHPVISVGNITAGGTGKTPVVAYLADLLKANGFRPIILSRGYKGSATSRPTMVSDGERIFCTVDECGDEPLILARQLSGSVIIVGKNRWESGRRFGGRYKNGVFLLDDGFQHLSLKRTLNLLLLDSTDPFGNGMLLPAGRLREPLSALQRADAVLLTRSHLVTDEPMAIEQALQDWNPGVERFRFSHESQTPYDVKTQTETEIEVLRSDPVGVFAGIGNPFQFLEDLQREGLRVIHKELFRDHYDYSQADIDRILSDARDAGAKRVITTEKDAVRLEKLDFGVDRIFALPIRATSQEQERFQMWIIEKIL